jgi:hypothetical protein
MVTNGKTALALPLYGQAYPIKEPSHIEIEELLPAGQKAFPSCKAREDT